MKIFTISESSIPTNRISSLFVALLLIGMQLILALPASSQNTGSIKGKVTDSKNTTLAGVTVKLEGNVPQTQSTDANGNYSFTNLRAGNYTVSLNFLGFTPSTSRVTLAAGQASVVNVVLAEETTNLDEIVVMGYGVQKKTSVTASVSSIQGGTVANLPVTNLTQALGGSLPGVIARQGSGEPGRDNATIYVRGISSTGSTSPLLIVDDIPRDYSSLDPSSIETITVLKDAAASAPYGVAGANGVILVTTKKGKTGLPSLSFKSFYGFQNPTILPEYPTSEEYAKLTNAASINGGGKAVYTDAELAKFKDGTIDPDKYPNTNGIDFFMAKNRPLVTQGLELSGGSERVKYYSSLGYMFEAGLFSITNVNRYNMTLNLDAEATKTTTVSLKLNGRQQTNRYTPVSTSRIFELIKYVLPIQPVFWSNGENATYVYPDLFQAGYTTAKTTQVFGQLSIDQKLPFVPGLSVRGQIGYDPTTTFNKAWRVPVHLWSANFNTTPYTFGDAIFEQTKPTLSQSVTQAQQLTYQASMSYDHTFGKHKISALLLGEAKANDSYSIGAGRNNYNLYVDEISLGSSTATDLSNTGSSSQGRQMGAVYRLQYGFNDKYLLEASGRYDGSYYFAPGKQWGFFPAFSAGWRVSQENFMKNNLPWVDNFKIKGSYGEVGQLAGSAFQFISGYGINGNAYVFGGTSLQSLSEGAESNPNITWERAKKSDVGFESSFWKGLITLDADYFHELRSNMLVTPDVVLPSEYGIGISQVNAGKMENNGVELSLGSRFKITKDLSATLGGTATYAKNKLLQIFEGTASFNSFNQNFRQTGRPLGTLFGYHALGYFQPSDFDATGKLLPGIPTPPAGGTPGTNSANVHPGDLRYQDTNGDGKVTNLDFVEIGKPSVPLLVFGVNAGFSYKGLRLDMLFQGTGARNFNMSQWGIFAFDAGRGANKNNLDYWTPDNPYARFPRITTSTPSNTTQTSDWWCFDAQYVRLKNLQLGYTLPRAWLQKVKIQNAVLNVTGQNLHTWATLPYWDVEGSSAQGGYPSQQVISLGLNVTF